MSEDLFRSVADTARWIAYHRATESDRPDALFKDVHARRLAGERGEAAGRKLQNGEYIALRTLLFDILIQQWLGRGPIDLVVNLGAGLDTRPYRLPLPSTLHWAEVDLPSMIDLKTEAMAGVAANCRVEMLACDLADAQARGNQLRALAAGSKQAMILSEGLLLYLTDQQVATLASELRALPSFRYWIVEILSPRAVKAVHENWGTHFEAAEAPMLFAPPDWRAFYAKNGWKTVEFRDSDQQAQAVGRAPPRPSPRWKLWASLRARAGDLLLGPGRHGVYESGVAVLQRR